MPRRLLSGDPVLVTRRRAAGAVAILTVVYVFQGAVLGCAVHENRRLAKKAEALAQEGRQAHDASCSRKRALAGRVDDTLEFLDENPQGIPGITPKLILRGARRDLEEFDSLAAVKCRPPVPPPRRPAKKQKAR